MTDPTSEIIPEDIDPAAFRRAMGCFATGITVITTRDTDGSPIGITANSFTSLSLDPPLVLFCLDRRSQTLAAFSEHKHFAVNVLADDQEGLSRNFARSDVDKFDGIAFESGETGCPLLPHCLTSFECQVEKIVDGGDHVILIGRVLREPSVRDGCQPLLFFRGRYGVLGS